MKKDFLFTTPIYYVNDKPHIGHLYTSLLTDSFARFYQILYPDAVINSVSGVDEHGQKIQKKAESENKKPIEVCNQNAEIFKNILVDFNLCCSYEKFSIKNFNKFKKTKELQKLNSCKLFNSSKNFIRTTEGREKDGSIIKENVVKNRTSHINFVTKVWNILYKNNWIYLGKYEGFYSIKDEAFYNEKELIDGKAPTGSDVFYKEEPCYFFRISQMKEIILDFLNIAIKEKNYIIPAERINEVIEIVKNHMKDLPISRIKKNETYEFNWGIPVPNDENHIIYVWLDALFNYISVLRKPSVKSAFKKWTSLNKFQFIGKEISKFHNIYWPCFLIGTQFKFNNKFKKLKFDNVKEFIFDKMFIHGWWTNEGKKISKSDGNMINPYQEIEDIISKNKEIEYEIAIDYFRLFLTSSFSSSKDADYSRQNLAEFVNSNLIKNIGNLVQRTISLYNKIPKKNLVKKEDLNQEIIKKIINKKNNLFLEEKLSKFDIFSISRFIFELGNILNKYINDSTPWIDIKNKNYKSALIKIKTTIYCLPEIARLLAPICPNISENIFNLLNINIEKGLRSTFKLEDIKIKNKQKEKFLPFIII